MPRLETWGRFPAAVRQHLIQRMHERSITLDDLNRLRLWVAKHLEVPTGLWVKDFGSFKLCGEGPLPKTFLLQGQPARGEML
ncbi:MAG: hypothetical protein M9913_06860 [Bryobacteraceae bacterium]|nr:hypothetical protein [Solibacteraceae bacterium]MCO5350604.1 hypothetical protein [Bryobacteraceae bacterium]